VTAVFRLGDTLNGEHAHAAAIALCRHALEQDPVAEAIYWRLIAAHLARLQNADALSA